MEFAGICPLQESGGRTAGSACRGMRRAARERMPTPKRSREGAPQTVRQGPPLGAKGFDTSAITVKNTFVDIASSPAAALRSVRTYGGALSMMGRQGSTNGLDIFDE